LLTKKKILITGGFGYIGGRLAEYLGGTGKYELILGSRRVRASTKATRKTVFVKMDWTSKESLMETCQDVDLIIHTAALNEVNCALDPYAAIEVNVVNTAKLLDAAKNLKIKHFIYLSTAHIYKSPLQGYIDEQTLPWPIHPYATSHRAAEDLVLALNAHTKETKGMVLRLSNGFGAPINFQVDRWTLLVNDLCRQAIFEKKMTLKTTGKDTRDFITLEDICRAIDHLIEKWPVIEGDKMIFNVGSGWTPTLLEMAEIVQSRCLILNKYKPPIKFGCVDNILAEALVFNTDKLKDTGFKCLNNINQEIDMTLKICSQVKEKNE
jgi:UDP-glucose 4-epimerase